MKPPIKKFKLADYPDGSITQWFGENPVLYSRWGLKAHNGLDVISYYGAPLYAVEDARVVDVKYDPSGFGKHVRLRSLSMEDGCHREWVYGHMANIHVVSGEHVKAGEKIGTMGNTGFVVSGGQEWWGGNNPDGMGTHCHLGVRLLEPSDDGWSYSGDYGEMKYIVKNYDNGYKGAIDPAPYFIDENFEHTSKGKKMLTIISLLNTIAGLLKKKVIPSQGK